LKNKGSLGIAVIVTPAVALLAGGSATAAGHARDNVHAGGLNGFRKAGQHLLGHLELRPAIRADLFFCGERLRDTDAGDLLSFRFCQRADLLRLLQGALILSLTLIDWMLMFNSASVSLVCICARD
jgi:hypothetical protein